MSPLPIQVCKLGGSVLRDEAALPLAVHELYRHLRRGMRVVAVVSALEGATDALFARGARVGEGADERALAALVATGEAQAAALLALALERAGVSTTLLDASAVRAEGPPLDAAPAALDVRRIRAALERHSAVVLPGYVGHGADGAPRLLGRGGSDLSALFVARELRAAGCALLKDVDGLYERDPRRDPGARRYAAITWDDALALGGEILQPKAARYAAERRIAFELRAPGAGRATRVGAERTRRSAPTLPRAPLRVGLAGVGTVGGGVLRALLAEPERFELVGALARRPRPELPAGSFVRALDELFERGCEALVECAGGIEPARSWIESALARGVDVVSANKAVLAEHGLALERGARRRGARLLASAAVGGALPALERARALARRRGLSTIEGVLNGTTSFVLDELARGAALDAAVARAIELGYAEADPRLDLDGTDVAHKLELLARAGGARLLEWGERRGVDALAPEELAPGRVTRLVGACAFEGARARLELAPRALAPEDPLAAPAGAALVLCCQDGTRELWTGRGAGRWPTTESVLADLGELARRRELLGARAGGGR